MLRRATPTTQPELSQAPFRSYLYSKSMVVSNPLLAGQLINVHPLPQKHVQLFRALNSARICVPPTQQSVLLNTIQILKPTKHKSEITNTATEAKQAPPAAETESPRTAKQKDFAGSFAGTVEHSSRERTVLDEGTCAAITAFYWRLRYCTWPRSWCLLYVRLALSGWITAGTSVSGVLVYSSIMSNMNLAGQMCWRFRDPGCFELQEMTYIVVTAPTLPSIFNFRFSLVSLTSSSRFFPK